MNGNPRLVLAFAGALTLALGLSACGGGGGGGGGGAPARPAFQVTVNADRSCDAACENRAGGFRQEVDFINARLSNIGAEYAYARGFSGRGVVVAVADSGLDLGHREFAGRIVDGYNAVSPGSRPDDTDGHGTGVAGVIASARDGRDMQGVAYGAQIMPLKIGTAGDEAYTNQWRRALNQGLSGAFVLNNSWGGEETQRINITNTGEEAVAPRPERFENLENDFVSALRNADNRDSIVVFAAGNDGWNTETGRVNATITANPAGGRRIGSQVELSPSSNLIGGWGEMPQRYPELVGHWLNVVAVDGANVIASFSNGCGVAQNWCLAAPGVGIRTADVVAKGGGGRQIASGTSFAAPHVSGAAAVLKGAFPNLSAKQVVRLLLITARDLGAPGVDEVYGHGLVDLEKATRPQTSSGCINGYQCPRSVGLRVAYSDSVENEGFKLEDFSTAALADSRIVASPALSPITQNVPVGFLDGFDRAYQANLNHFVSNAVAPRAGFFFQPHLRDRTLRNGFYALGAAGDAPLAFGWKTSNGGVSADFFEVRPGGGARVSAARPGTDFAFALGAENVRGMAVVSQNFIAGFSRAEGGNGADFHQAALAFSRDGAGWDAAWETGLAVEQGSALGAKFGGAFAVRRARTLYGRLAGSFSLSPRARIFATGTVGRSRADAGSGAVASFSELRSRGWEAGVAGDSWRLSYSRPLRTSSGEMRFRTAGGYDESGGYVVRESRADLSSSRSWRASAEWTDGKTTRLRSEIGEGRRVNVAAEFLF